MNRSKLAASLLALALGVSATAASAQPRDREDRDRGHDRDRGAQQHRDHRGPPDYRGPNRPQMRVDRGPGAGPDHRFYRGDRLPPDYRHRTYVVQDWRGHRLHAPQRGYQWVQLGADYALIAIATGVIAQVILAH